MVAGWQVWYHESQRAPLFCAALILKRGRGIIRQPRISFGRICARLDVDRLQCGRSLHCARPDRSWARRQTVAPHHLGPTREAVERAATRTDASLTAKAKI